MNEEKTKYVVKLGSYRIPKLNDKGHRDGWVTLYPTAAAFCRVRGLERESLYVYGVDRLPLKYTVLLVSDDDLSKMFPDEMGIY